MSTPSSSSSSSSYDYTQDAIVLAEEPDSDTETDVERSIASHNLLNPDEVKSGFGVKIKSETEIKSTGLFNKVESETGVKWMATKPWKGAIVAPTSAPTNNPTKPDQGLALDWIHGYRGFDARSNLVYNAGGNLVYPVAGVCVVYDQKEHKQAHFMGHNDDVTCLAQNPVNANIIATGQVATIVARRATKPHICVWDSSAPTDKSKCVVLPNAGQKAIRSVGFSADGRLLASVENDDKFSVTVWDWAERKALAKAEGDGQKVFQVKWNHKVPGEFVTVGEKHLYFWSWDGTALKRTKARMGGKYPWQSFGAVTFSEKGYACAGAFDGSIYVFIAGEAKKVVKVHANKINSLDWFAGGLVSGGADCKAVVLDKTLTPIRTLSFKHKVSSVYISPGENLLVGTAGAEIIQIPSFRTESKEPAIPTIRGHCEGELWGLGTSPDGKTFVTCGEDNRVMKWDLANKRCISEAVINEKRAPMPKVLRASTESTLPPNQCARAVAISPNGADIAIGANDGFVHIYDSASMTKKASVDLNAHGKRMITGQKGNWIQVLKYSPTGGTLAVGTHGSVICLLDTRRYEVGGVLDKHNSFIMHLDWSRDGAFMQSNCGAYELLFWSVDEKELKSSRQVTSVSSLRDTVWHTQTCILGWSVQGIFDPSQDGTDVNTVDTSPSRRIIATGDDYGDVNLFRYPCSAEGNEKKSYIGHSSHVVTTRFTPDERYLISVGGNDKAIFVWRVA